MDSAQELAQQTKGKNEDNARPNENENENENESHHTSIANTNNNNNFQLPKLTHYKKWIRVITYILFLLVGQTTGILLLRLYFAKGGNSKWMATFVQTAGFPILIPLKFYFSFSSPNNFRPSLFKLTSLYFAFGLLVTGDNLMYSYGILNLPVSTYALLCASQLAFSAVTSFFINSQKITALVLNSIVIITISTCLLAINANDEGNASNNVARGRYVIGFICTLGASATYALLLSVAQFSFEKVIKDESFNTVVCMQLYPSFVATCGCVIGLFASGEWRTLPDEMRNYKKGRVPYVMILASTAITFQVASVGLLGLIFEISSLFSNVISTLSLPLVPIFAIVFFHDRMNGVKVISLVLAIWGFLSYIYQHYLDGIEAKKARNKSVNGIILGASSEMC